ncbi:hypothetical protein QWY75_04720 [Pontixanthobacter aestiaquae]|uniref:PsiF repeat-containing protein n=1 Tax=Pontixanthobacter aestiaquae TaxID=1509367 RepID=A0A844Z9G8_9SPHN|nr:hypothetical protein [Pontixanthobacter aestiaquae]MDN3645512.1 hypothetical protein [Pontixanthobacter aestiaquae]MXO83490.1 hypothetical protein [Pontixanthobacter aestiaquae]
MRIAANALIIFAAFASGAAIAGDPESSAEYVEQKEEKKEDKKEAKKICKRISDIGSRRTTRKCLTR